MTCTCSQESFDQGPKVRYCSLHLPRPSTTPLAFISSKARAKWWFSNTDSSLYRIARGCSVLTRNWLFLPGWSTSCMAAATSAANTSSWVKIGCRGEGGVAIREHGRDSVVLSLKAINIHWATCCVQMNMGKKKKF